MKIITCPHCGAKNRVQESTDKQAVCGRCHKPLTIFDHPLTIADRDFKEKIEQSPLPVLLDLWAPWCGPCRMVAPAVSELAKDFAGRALIGKVNVDENPQTAARFAARSIPLIVILIRGREVSRLVGAQSKEAMARELSKFL